MSKNVGVVLSGCGVYDGAEIHEAVLTFLALDQRGATVTIAAPNVDQAHVINHLDGSVSESETRNVLIESARIARGEIKDLAELKAEDIDALIFPGGFGAAKNLCSFAFDGTEMTVNPEVERIVSAMRAANKPIGFICITPAMAAKMIPGVKITLGAKCDASEAAESMGATHEETTVSDTVIDADKKVVTCAAYMLGPWVAEVHKGIDKLVGEVLELA